MLVWVSPTLGIDRSLRSRAEPDGHLKLFDLVTGVGSVTDTLHIYIWTSHLGGRRGESVCVLWFDTGNATHTREVP